MSSALLRFSSNFAATRKSVSGIYLLASRNLSANSYSKKGFATSTKTQDENFKPKKLTPEDQNEVVTRLTDLFAAEEKLGKVVPIFKKSLLYGHKIAVKDDNGEFSYIQLYKTAKKLSFQFSNLCGSGVGNRVAFLCRNDVTYPMVQWGCWFSGQVAVPLSHRHPPELLKYFISDSQASLIVTTPEYESLLRPIAESLSLPIFIVDHSLIPEVDTQTPWLTPKNDDVVPFGDEYVAEGALTSDFYSNSNAMILYTSGTTGRPKGVVLTHKNINSQIKCLLHAWQFSSKDTLLHVLPLNHVHGCVNALMCPLSVGSKVVMHNNFDSHNVWSTLLGINTPAKDRVNMFMGVPTIYNMLIDEFDKIFSKNSRMIEYIENHCKKNIRLMVSGSAPLPVTVFNRWLEISGHRLLERYGMTEIGMALSNPYTENKKWQRTPGSVGNPLPGVEVRIINSVGVEVYRAKGEEGKGYWARIEQPTYESITPKKEKSTEIVGELQVKGPNVFEEYFNRPEATKMAFDSGFFKTGDTASFENGTFKILGRSSVDIIKTGGYKVSALEIETEILNHPGIKDVAVVGVEDITWGEKVAAVAVLRENTEIDLESLKVFCSDKLAAYQIPSVLITVSELPRNAMGKLNKKDLIHVYFKGGDKLTEQKPSIAEQTRTDTDLNKNK